MGRLTIQANKFVADVAAAQKVFAARHGLSQECIGYAHRIEIHALAKLGALLHEVEKQAGSRGRKGGGTRGSKKELQVNAPPTLADLGVSKKTSAIAQQLAALPEATREAIAKQETTLSAVRRTQKAQALDRRLTLPDAKYRVLYADPPGARRSRPALRPREKRFLADAEEKGRSRRRAWVWAEHRRAPRRAVRAPWGAAAPGMVMVPGRGRSSSAARLGT